MSYLLHSSVILGLVLLFTRFTRFISAGRQDALLKIALIAGILTASIQFIYSSNGTFSGLYAKPLVFDMAPAKVVPIPLAQQFDNLQASANDVAPAVAPVPLRDNLLQNFFNKISLLQWFLWFWLVGSSVLALRFFWHWRQFLATVGQRRVLSHAPTVALCQQLKQQMGIGRSVKITEADNICSPMSIGLSEVCLPAGLWHDVDQDQLTAIIAHELAHVMRMDPLWLFFWHVMSVVFFFQPLNRLTLLSFQARAEFLADAIAVQQTKDPIAMVNSLIGAAKRAKVTVHRLVSHLLGQQASIVARSKSLLDENPLQAQSSLMFIITVAVIVVALAASGLPAISIASKPINQNEYVQQRLTPANSAVWQVSQQPPLAYGITFDHQEAIAGLAVQLNSRHVVFDQDFDSIVSIAANGQLQFSTQSIYAHHSLVVSADDQSQLRFRYLVDQQRVDDQQAAMQFLAQVLDIVIGRSDEFKRKRMIEFSDKVQPKVATDPKKVTEMMLHRALRNEQQIYSLQDLLIAQAMNQSVDLFSQTTPRWPQLGQPPLADQAQQPQPSPFINGIVRSGGHIAMMDESGLLNIRTTAANGLIEGAKYDLNNQGFYDVFLSSADLPYQFGDTELAMVKFLIRLHFNRPDDQWLWITE